MVIMAMTKEEAQEYSKRVEGWKLVNDSIEKNYKFSNFRQAIEFINKVAEVADSENHHPDILLWNWNNVKLTVTTHAVKGLSSKDFALAAHVDQIK